MKGLKYANVHQALRRDLGTKSPVHSLDLFLRPCSLDHASHRLSGSLLTPDPGLDSEGKA